jgi:DNA-binding response OmpR family regulator
MTAAIRTALSTFRKPKRAPVTHFVDEDLHSVPASGVPEEFRKLSRFMPMIVLVPRSAVGEKAVDTELRPNQPVVFPVDTAAVVSPLHAAKAWLKNPGLSDTFEFGSVTGCFSTMEILRDGRPVDLTCKQFKTLKYLFLNARRVISRNELLDQVWGYECYPCTRTVDNHILQLRRKLEAEPSRPKHFLTIHGSGYKFLP